MKREDLVDQFEFLLKDIDRAGMPKLLAYLKDSDFYDAPASTRYHSCHRGGLAEHSLNVYKILQSKAVKDPIWSHVLATTREDSIKIAGLLHDVCKTNFYVTELKNKKIYSETGSKVDSNGRYDWQTVEGYTVDDKAPLGHGEKSAIMLLSFIELTKDELYAIRWHMGFTESKDNWNYLSRAIREHPLILALHEADLEATYLVEKEE